ncbi:hypothetical protein EVAR_3739_1 [Eumeta japonica]|uniref:Uncharacterized protein n=1 Tax=Eumeta variegata TaxID=151549 RepID=A0A4C1SS69_EUMVA|nr:hypothetical protein EVAR_3739_1 [Eumeta japonica]
MTFTLAGEVFPLRYRSLASGISTLFCIRIFLNYCTTPLAGGSIRSACRRGGAVPGGGDAAAAETKDRTLRDIGTSSGSVTLFRRTTLSSPSVLISVMKSRL